MTGECSLQHVRVHYIVIVSFTGTSRNIRLYSGVGRWFHLRGLQEPPPPPPPQKMAWIRGYRGPARDAYFPCARNRSIMPVPGAPVFPTPLFHIALVACQDFYGGASPRSPRGSYATVISTESLDCISAFPQYMYIHVLYTRQHVSTIITCTP